MKVLKETFDRLFALFSGRENACGKKHQYSWPVHATKAAYNMEVKYPGETFDVYRCPFCDYYHIGHTLNPAELDCIIVKTAAEQEIPDHLLDKLIH